MNPFEETWYVAYRVKRVQVTLVPLQCRDGPTLGFPFLHASGGVEVSHLKIHVGSSRKGSKQGGLVDRREVEPDAEAYTSRSLERLPVSTNS